MNEIREIVTKAVVAKGKKLFNMHEHIESSTHPYSILGCWIINHEFEAYKNADVVTIEGQYELNVWYSYLQNTKTEVLREKIKYKKDIKVKQVVKNYLDNNDDIIAKVLAHPTVTNAKILEDGLDVDVTMEILAEVIGETKMQVTVFTQTEPQDDIEDLDIDVDEDFLNKEWIYIIHSFFSSWKWLFVAKILV